MFKKKEKIELGISVYYYKEKNRLTLVIPNCHTNINMLSKLLEIGTFNHCEVIFHRKSSTEKTMRIEYEGSMLENVEEKIKEIFKDEWKRHYY